MLGAEQLVRALKEGGDGRGKETVERNEGEGDEEEEDDGRKVLGWGEVDVVEERRRKEKLLAPLHHPR